MTDLPESHFLNPVLTALWTNHAHFAITHGAAVRYPAAVTPFAAISSPTPKALSDLRSLLAPKEFIWAAALGDSNLRVVKAARRYARLYLGRGAVPKSARTKKPDAGGCG